jgi:CheY-like chemotaxis protein/nitrogen-specific signal transduction histidine kinase
MSIPSRDGGIAGSVGTMADVTAEAGAEAVMADARDKATEASRLKSDFLANVSHEIRTPMNGVIGMADLLLETDLDPHQRDYAQTVRNSGEALLTIINDVLDFSKIEAGKLTIENISFDLRACVADVVNLLASSAQSKGLEFISVIERSVPTMVSGDPGRVRQVLTNLIGNAIKFTHSGEVLIRATVSDEGGTDALIRFDISDTGDGIVPDKVDAVFLPFVQADSSTSRKYGGTGLGLAISSHLIGLMGGEYGVASVLGAGSTFWFTIRVHVDPDQAAHPPLSPDPELADVVTLVVDDNDTQREVVAGFLSDLGTVVHVAATGEEALATLHAAAGVGVPIEVALIDRSMPSMSGLELRDAIVADPTLSPRLVLMTDLGHEHDAGEADSGICETLSKPIEGERIQRCLRLALGLQVADPIPDRAPALRPPSAVDHRGRLLLAEDNLINQKVAVAMLSRAGYQVDAVLNGAAAVEAAANHLYAAILMDCQMPVLTGYEATAAIRAEEGADRHTPIIAMTAGARREDRDRCLAAGMDGYLAKPVSREILLAMVTRLGRTTDAAAPDPDDGVPDEIGFRSRSLRRPWHAGDRRTGSPHGTR